MLGVKEYHIDEWVNVTTSQVSVPRWRVDYMDLAGVHRAASWTVDDLDGIGRPEDASHHVLGMERICSRRGRTSGNGNE